VGTGSFPGVKQPGRGVDHPPPSSAEVEETVELKSARLGFRGLFWGELYLYRYYNITEVGNRKIPFLVLTCSLRLFKWTAVGVTGKVCVSSA